MEGLLIAFRASTERPVYEADVKNFIRPFLAPDKDETTLSLL